MIQGIGIDLVELKDFTEKINKESFVERILSINEREVFNQFKSEKRKIEYLGSRFASKEAFSKALSSYDGKTNFNDIEILNEESGKPYLIFLRDKNIKTFISLSHTDNYAVAEVIIYK